MDAKAPHHHYLRVFLYAAVFWTVLGALHLASLSLGDILAGREHDLSARRWLVFLTAYLSWSFLTTFVYWLVERDPPSREHWRWLGACLATMAVWLLVLSLLVQMLSSLAWPGPPRSIGAMLAATPPFLYLFNALKFMLTYGLCAGIVNHRRLLEARLALLRLERSAAEALEKKARFELQALQAQLSPHFLFNALNAVSGLARNQDHNGVVDVVARLAELLRYALDATRRSEVPLEDELRFTANYVALQSVRFGPGFRYQLALDAPLERVFCPPFCLQTLVENVFVHNDVSVTDPVEIAVAIGVREGQLVIEVANTLETRHAGGSTGLGLQNLRDRLQLQYGEAARVSIALTPAQHLATVCLPMEAA